MANFRPEEHPRFPEDPRPLEERRPGSLLWREFKKLTLDFWGFGGGKK